MKKFSLLLFLSLAIPVTTIAAELGRIAYSKSIVIGKSTGKGKGTRNIIGTIGSDCDDITLTLDEPHDWIDIRIMGDNGDCITDCVPASDGSATVDISMLNAGNYTILVDLDGDGTYSGAFGFETAMP